MDRLPSYGESERITAIVDSIMNPPLAPKFNQKYLDTPTGVMLNWVTRFPDGYFAGCDYLKSLSMLVEDFHATADGLRGLTGLVSLKALGFSRVDLGALMVLPELKRLTLSTDTPPDLTGLTKLENLDLTCPVLEPKMFAGCTALKELCLETKAAEFPEGIFDGLENLVIVRIRGREAPHTEFNETLFAGCPKLETVVLSDGIRVLPAYERATQIKYHKWYAWHRKRPAEDSDTDD